MNLFGCMKIPPSLSLLVPKHSSSSITSSCCRLLRKRYFNIRKIILNIHGLPRSSRGVAFSKTAVGREFLDFFGENLFRTDTGIERESLGSLLDHSGPIKESEAYAAQVLVHMQVTRCLMAHRALIAPLWPLSWEISRSHCVIVTVINPLSRDWSCRVHYRYFLFQPVIAMALLDQFLKRNSNPRLLHKN